jgi:MSHA biogenesis protein MshL
MPLKKCLVAMPLKNSFVAMCLSGLLLLSSCSSHRDKPMAAEKELDTIVAQQAEQSKQNAQAAEAAAQTQKNNLTLKAAELNPFTERFDVSVRAVSAKEFFLGLVNGTGINVVVHPDVSGSITLDLKKVTIDEVLRITRDIYGFEYKQEGGIYTIYANALRTEVFHINYLDVQRVGVSDTSVLIGRAQSNNNNSGGGNGFGNGGQGNSGASDTSNLLGMLDNGDEKKGGNSGTSVTPGSRVQTLNKTDFWSTLQATIVSIVGAENASRSVTVSPQAGMVVIKALPSEISAVREFLERSELSVKRQVILEAKILEVRLSEGFEAGVNWGAISGKLAHTHNLADGTPINTDGSLASINKFRSLATAAGTSREAMGNTFASLLQVQDVGQLLNLLETQGSVQVLSSPRVSTVNNQKAVIRVGSDEYFVTGISTNTTSNATSVSSTPNIELSPFFSGISLDVTPQISENGEVVLHIHPVVSDVSDQQKVFTIGDKNFALPLALRGIRESDSIVKAGNGQVIVLGGLMQESKNNVDGKRPWIGDIPIINTFFRSKSKAKSKTELVILLRPIVVDDNAWKNQLLQSQENMKNIGEAYRKQ